MTKQAIAAALRELGVPAHLRGYRYLAYAIGLVLEDHDMIYQMTKALYPAVAQQFNTTATAAERCIRGTVEAAFDRGSPEAQQKYFGNSVRADKGKLANREFIAAVVEYLEVDTNGESITEKRPSG